MSFSELKLIAADTGLEWDESRLALSGVLYDYPIVIADIPARREYLLTVFCRVRSDVDKPVTSGITALLDKLPPNCVTGRTNQLRYQQLRLNANLLYQENLSYLAELATGLAELLNGFDLVPEPLEEAIAFPAVKSAAKPAVEPEVEPAVPAKKQKRPKDSVSKRFDGYSIRGFIGAVLGAAAMTALSSLIDMSEDGNIGSMAASWLFGGLIAFVTLMDYRFLARKMDVFGTLSCTALTALACFAGAAWNTANSVVERAKLIDPGATLNSVLANRDLYLLLFPDAESDFPLTLVKFLFSAAVASALFYTVYYSRHSAIMYSEDGDFIPKS